MGNARIELTRVPNERKPLEFSFLMTETEVGCELANESHKNALIKAGIQIDEISNCPLNENGEKVKAHIF